MTEAEQYWCGADDVFTEATPAEETGYIVYLEMTPPVPYSRLSVKHRSSSELRAFKSDAVLALVASEVQATVRLAVRDKFGRDAVWKVVEVRKVYGPGTELCAENGVVAVPKVA